MLSVPRNRTVRSYADQRTTVDGTLSSGPPWGKVFG
jgi:hypothetical protein